MLAASAASPMIERQAHAEDRGYGCADVVCRVSEEHRLIVAALRRHHPAHRHEERIETRLLSQRAGLSKPGHRRGDDGAAEAAPQPLPGPPEARTTRPDAV